MYRGGFRIILTRFYILRRNLNIGCNPSLEPSRWDGLNEGYNVCFYLEIWAIFPEIFLLLVYLEHYLHVHLKKIDLPKRSHNVKLT